MNPNVVFSVGLDNGNQSISKLQKAVELGVSNFSHYFYFREYN